MTDQPVALISAGASGIGLACARALAEAGHRVLTLDINVEAIAQFQNEFGEGSAVVCDMSDAAQVEAAFLRSIDSQRGWVFSILASASSVQDETLAWSRRTGIAKRRSAIVQRVEDDKRSSRGGRAITNSPLYKKSG